MEEEPGRWITFFFPTGFLAVPFVFTLCFLAFTFKSSARLDRDMFRENQLKERQTHLEEVDLIFLEPLASGSCSSPSFLFLTLSTWDSSVFNLSQPLMSLLTFCTDSISSSSPGGFLDDDLVTGLSVPFSISSLVFLIFFVGEGLVEGMTGLCGGESGGEGEARLDGPAT
jgi:hypothetical protein